MDKGVLLGTATVVGVVATSFVSADDHWKAHGQDHAAHYGDVLGVFVNGDGSADSRSTVRRIDRLAWRVGHAA
jgi:Cu/Zn superoxide dismutase